MNYALLLHLMPSMITHQSNYVLSAITDNTQAGMAEVKINLFGKLSQ